MNTKEGKGYHRVPGNIPRFFRWDTFGLEVDPNPTRQVLVQRPSTSDVKVTVVPRKKKVTGLAGILLDILKE